MLYYTLYSHLASANSGHLNINSNMIKIWFISDTAASDRVNN
jgi:hypothetical protein